MVSIVIIATIVIHVASSDLQGSAPVVALKLDYTCLSKRKGQHELRKSVEAGVERPSERQYESAHNF